MPAAIPGFIFNTFGQKFAIAQQSIASESLLIIGTAIDGPINEAKRITNLSDLKTLFGPSIYENDYLDPLTGTATRRFTGASLMRAASSALANKCSNLWVLRATGTYATSPSAFGSTLNIKAIYPGSIYNQVKLTSVTTGSTYQFILDQPISKGGKAVITMPTSGATVSEVIEAIQKSSLNRTITIEYSTFSSILGANALATIPAGTIKLGAATGVGSSVGATLGANETRNLGEAFAETVGVDGYFKRLADIDHGTFDVLEGRRVGYDVITLADLYFDDQIVTSGQPRIGGTDTYSSYEEYSTSVANTFVVWLERMSKFAKPCVGVLGCRPSTIKTQGPAWITYLQNNLLDTTAGFWNKDLRWIKAGFIMGQGFGQSSIDPTTNSTFDLGGRLIVTVGDVIVNDVQTGAYMDSHHVHLAGKLTTIPPESSYVLTSLAGIAGYGPYVPFQYAVKLNQGVGYDQVNEIEGKAAYNCLVHNSDSNRSDLVVFNDSTASTRNDYFCQWQITHLCNRVTSDLSVALKAFINQPADAFTLEAMKTLSRNILDGYTESGAFNGGEGVGYVVSIGIDTVNGGYITGIVNVALTFTPSTLIRQIRMNLTLKY